MRRPIALVAAGILALWPALTVGADLTPIQPVPQDEFIPIEAPPTAWPTSRPVPVIYETRPEAPQPTKPAIPVLTSTPKVVVVLVPPVRAPRVSHSLTGRASWYCKPGVSSCSRGYPASGAYAAAGPKLRAAICGVQSCTSWRGRTVYVDNVRVTLIDWCQCYWHQSNEKLIDLYYSVYRQVGGNVTISWR